jgi:hypothetical protein
MLYLPEVVSPYGFLPPFYYNNLKVYGGIFLSVPGSEHGKAAALPWKATILRGEGMAGIHLDWQDTLNIPYTFNRMYGRTGLKFSIDVTLHDGAKYLEYKVRAENPSDAAKSYEAWVATTVADHDGSGPGSNGAHMLVPVDRAVTKAANWPWVEQVETRIADPERDDLYTFDQLQYAENYFGYYIGNPLLSEEARWWAIINPESAVGLLSLRGDDPLPKGQKYWSWGYRIGERGQESAVPYYPKPYLEHWVGVSAEFGVSREIGPRQAEEFTLAFYPLTPNATGAEENVLLPSRAPKERLRLTDTSSFPRELTYRYEKPYEPDSVLTELDRKIGEGFASYPADVISLLYQGGYYERAAQLISKYRTAEVADQADQMLLQVLLMDDQLAAAERHFTTTMDGSVDGFVASAVDFYSGWNDQAAKILNLDAYVVAQHGRTSAARAHVLHYLNGKPGFRNPLNIEMRKEILASLADAPELGMLPAFCRAVIALQEGAPAQAADDLREVLAASTDPELREEVLGYIARAEQDAKIARGEMPEFTPLFPQLAPGQFLVHLPWEKSE